MHALTIILGLEAAALAALGIWCLRAGKSKLAFAPLVCATMIGVVMAQATKEKGHGQNRGIAVVADRPA